MVHDAIIYSYRKVHYFWPQNVSVIKNVGDTLDFDARILNIGYVTYRMFHSDIDHRL